MGPMQWVSSIVAFVALLACGGDDGGVEVTLEVIAETSFATTSPDVAPDVATEVEQDVATEAEPDSAAEVDVAEVTPVVPVADAWQGVTVAGCGGLGPGTEDCAYRYLWRPAACGGGCSRLVIYWAGGEQSCAEGRYDPLLEKWANAGFAVACAQPFMTSQESGRYPYADELERMDLLTRRVRADLGSAWDGRFLAIAGVSHGATAPVAAIAKSRAFVNRPDVWTGRDGTAVVLFDGISDPARLEATIGLSDDPACPSWHARFVGRYGAGSPLVHGCANDACYCAGGGSGWDRDTTVVGQTAGPNWPASPYVCDDLGTPEQRVAYRIVSCGGGQNGLCAADGDIIPDDQQTRLSDALQTCGDIAVTYADHPGCAHSLCGTWDFCGGERAVEWLLGLGW